MRLLPKSQDIEPDIGTAPFNDAAANSGFYYLNRGIFTFAGFAAFFWLLLWGYIIMPRTGAWFWLWLISVGGIAGAATYFYRKELVKAQTCLKNPQLRSRRKFQLSLGLVFILVLGIAFNLAVVFANPQPLDYDAIGYSDEGFNIAQQGYTADAIRTPGYPFFVGLVYKVAGGEKPLRGPVFGLSDPVNINLVALSVAQVFLLSLTAFMVYGLTNRITNNKRKKEDTNKVTTRFYPGEPLPLLAAFLVAFCPFLWGYTGTALTEIYSSFWLTLSVLLWVNTLRFRQVWCFYLLTGLALAFTMETRPTFVYLPFLALASFFLVNKGRWRFYSLLFTVVPLLLVLIPPLSSNLRDWNEPTPLIAGDLSTYQTSIGIFDVMWGGMPRYQKIPSAAASRITAEDKARLENYVPSQQTRDKAKRHAESDYWKTYFSNYVSRYPLEFSGTMLERAWFQWNQHFLFPYYDPAYWDYRLLTDNLNRLYLLFGLAGLAVVLFTKRFRFGFLPLYASLFYLMGLNLLVRAEFRYTLPAYPLLLIFAAFGFRETCTTLLRLFKRSSYNQTEKEKVKPGLVLGGAGVALLLVGTLSFAKPLIPSTTKVQEKALDAVYASQKQAESCYYTASQASLQRAIALDGTNKEVVKWQLQFPKEIKVDETTYTRRIAADPTAISFENYRCLGDLYRVKGQTDQAKTNFQLYLKYGPPGAQNRQKVLIWLKELGGAG